jgi:hypothetical protein
VKYTAQDRIVIVGVYVFTFIVWLVVMWLWRAA